MEYRMDQHGFWKEISSQAITGVVALLLGWFVSRMQIGKQITAALDPLKTRLSKFESKTEEHAITLVKLEAWASAIKEDIAEIKELLKQRK